MTKYMVITEIVTAKGTQRWYYGIYDKARANEVALELGNDSTVYHSVIRADEAEAFGVLNLPR